MRVFVAGASGVIGMRPIPLLVKEGHGVVGMTRSNHKADKLATLGQPQFYATFTIYPH